MKPFRLILLLFITLAGIMILLFACEKVDVKRVVKIETQSVSDIKPDSAIATGEILDLGDEEIIEHGHCWSTLDSPTISLTTKTPLGKINSRGVFTSQLFALIPDTTYYVKAYATDALGTTVYGSQKSFPTPGYAPEASFTASQTAISAGQSVQFTDQSTNTPTSWSWNFGDGGTITSRNPSHIYSAAGAFTVVLTASNSYGSDVETKPNYITVGNAPTAAFTATPTTLATGQNVQFTDQSTNTPASWSWNFGDGKSSTLKSPVHTYTSAGSYTVTLTATNSYGSDDETKSNYIKVGNKPVAAFSGIPTNIEPGQSVQFTDQSTNTPTSWSWNFGDSKSSTLKSPAHTYASAGTFTVTLTATNSYGSDNETKSGYIKVNVAVVTPAAAFTASSTTVTVNQSVQFTDQSTNTPTSWSWSFGDGGTSTSKSPSHVYLTPGNYTVSLTATNSAGSDTETKTGYITVNAVVVTPVAAFRASSVIITAGQGIQFTDQSTNTPTSWSWNFGDAGTSTSQNPSHLYPTAGTYTVSLTATNSAGSDTEIKTNYITVDKLCPTSITVYHTAGLVSPVTKTVIYEIVETTLSGVNKCWISRNLGADNQAGSATDATEAAAGWYWQFNRKQGYKHDGTTRTPSSTWITPIDENSNWTAANDPCSINLGLGWHIPTYTEWTNVVNNGGWNDYGDTYASVLKLHVNGSLTNTGSLSGRGSYGFRWSSAQFSTNNGWYLSFASTYCSIGSNGYKAFAYSIRCIRD